MENLRSTESFIPSHIQPLGPWSYAKRCRYNESVCIFRTTFLKLKFLKDLTLMIYGRVILKSLITERREGYPKRVTFEIKENSSEPTSKTCVSTFW